MLSRADTGSECAEDRDKTIVGCPLPTFQQFRGASAAAEWRLFPAGV